MMERMWGKRNICLLLVGVQTGTATSEISMESPQKLGINLPQDAAISPLDIYQKDAQSHQEDMCSTMFILALFIIARTWKQPRCPSTNKQKMKR